MISTIHYFVRSEITLEIFQIKTETCQIYLVLADEHFRKNTIKYMTFKNLSVS
jgi:hypothetical protein